MNVLFLIPYPLGEAPSQRFRFEQYLKPLENSKIHYKFQSFYSLQTWKILYKQGFFLQKTLGLLSGCIKRSYVLTQVHRYQYVFIHREALPIGPPLIEWIIAKLFRKKIIYDFDDAIWKTDDSTESVLVHLLKWRSKVAHICRWSYKVSCGNDYLIDFARKHNNNVVFLPTTIDTTHQHNPKLFNSTKLNKGKVTIGWTGTHSTLKYLYDIVDVLSALEKKYDLEIVVIANKRPSVKLKSLHFLQWNKQTEISDLLKIDIGIMPLPDDEWTKGKGGFKALQFMALQIPCVLSPVGINNLIVKNGESGFFATTKQEWGDSLELLISNDILRENVGKKGRETVINYFSVEANTRIFLSLFE